MLTFKINSQRGFTLIELMIGLALGLIASLAIFSTISTFESQRRATGSGADMQQNGLFALYTIEQDIRLAGFGLIDASTHTLPCTQINGLDVAPVTLTDGTGSDTIAIHRLDSVTGGMVTGSQAAMLTSALSASPTLASIVVDTVKAIHANDYLLVPGLNAGASYDCSLIQATSLPAVAPAPQPAPTASLIDLGSVAPAFSELSYAVNAAYDLVQSNAQFNSASLSWGAATANPVANNIVNVQAQYGVSDPGNPSAGLCWTDAAGKTTCPATNPTPGADWSAPPAIDIKRIQAIRVAIVARNAQIAPGCTDTTAPVSYATLVAKNPVGIANWGWSGCYRYKVYQTIIPIRNVIWGGL